MADRTGLTIVGLIHHNKSGSSDPLQAIMASRAFTAVARSVHSVVLDPDDETEQRRFFGTPKNNLGKGTPTLAFHITGYTIPVTGDIPIITGKVNWDGEVDTSIRKAMESANANSQVSAVRTRKEEAKEGIREYLEAHGGEAPSSEVKEALGGDGFPSATITRAREQMEDVRVDPIPGKSRSTMWVLTSMVAEIEEIAS